jgi:hypothetical protein
MLLLALAACAHTANVTPFRVLTSEGSVLLETSTKALESSLTSADSGETEVTSEDTETEETETEETETEETEVEESDYEDGEYYYAGEDDSETVSSMVNEYHSGEADYDSSDAYISGGIEECDDCTSAVVPVGEYDEYVQYFTTEYDEYYLVRVPVTRHDVYTIKEVPETEHSVYYTTGDYEVQDQVTECDDCSDDSSTESTESSGSSESSESSESSVSSSESSSSSSSVTKKTTSSSSESSEESAEVDTTSRKSSTSEASSEESSESTSEESSESSETTESTESYDEDGTCEVADDMTVTEVDSYTEYIVQEVDGGCEHCDDELFLQVKADSYPQLSGDLYDNDETDSSYLTLVSPSSDTEQVTWSDIYDGDDSEYEDDLEDTDNPAALQESFLQAVDNALGRDEDDLPDDVDDEGDDQVDGDFLFLIVSSFEDGVEGTGKIIVVPKDEDEENFTLIDGLDKPVGICFDNNNEFLYVADPTYGDTGYLYQFVIDWDDDDTFTLKSNEYTIVYSGANPYSCFVDEYGNVYFTDASENKINMISYLDLWSGYTNYYYTLYERDDDTQEIDTPVGINVYDSADLYFVNNNIENGAPVLAKTDANVKGTNSKEIKRKVEGKSPAWAVAVSDDYVYFTTTEGSLWVMDREDKSEASEKASKFFAEARGVCYGDDDIYVADYSRGEIYEFSDDDDEETGNAWETIENPYAVYCVNSAYGLALSLLSAILLQ